MSQYCPWIIDIEASGFGPHSYPIEIGIVDDHGNVFCKLITPADDWVHWDKEAELIHKIKPALLKKYGWSIQEVASELNEFLRGKTVHSDGWVVDKPWIIKLFHSANITPDFFISPIESILNEEQLNSWDKIKIQVINDLKLQRHRASSDARVIQETYLRTRYPDNFTSKSENRKE